MKICSSCKAEKPVTEFYSHSRSADGFQSDCKACQRARNARPHFKRWRNMKARIFNQNHKEYSNYGGRGITMHPDWINDYPAFRDWLEANLGSCPEGHSLDRINNEGNYVPGNLRWASPLVQTHNRRVSIPVWSERKAA
jgi:hypothetical protein